jgi:hypothetical protein
LQKLGQYHLQQVKASCLGRNIICSLHPLQKSGAESSINLQPDAASFGTLLCSSGSHSSRTWESFATAQGVGSSIGQSNGTGNGSVAQRLKDKGDPRGG